MHSRQLAIWMVYHEQRPSQPDAAAVEGSSLSTASSHEGDANIDVTIIAFSLVRLRQQGQASFDLLHSD